MLVALPNAFGDAATNMAIDAALLASLPAGLAALRHYGWTEPAATFGYAQAYESVLSAIPAGQGSTSATDLPAPPCLVRRLTGGGIVDHRNDWTYALVLHPSLPSAKTSATELYQQIHRAIAQTLEALRIETHLAPCPKACAAPSHASQPPHPASRIPHPASHTPHRISHIPHPISHPASQCFTAPAANDVLRADGRKIAGAAMKRSRGGLLIQGSIDRGALPPDFDYPQFQTRLVAAFATALTIPTGTLEDIRPLFPASLIEQEKRRFASDAWNRRR